MQGIQVDDRRLCRRLVGLADARSACSPAPPLVIGYGLLGATWLVMKTEGDFAEPRRANSRGSSGIAHPGVLIGAVSLWTPFLNPALFRALVRLADRHLQRSSCRPLVAVMRLVALSRPRRAAATPQPFLAALGLFVLCYAGIGISFYPYIVPPSVTIWQAAAPEQSLVFLLVGAAVLIPIILAYTGYAYWVFRGKVDPSGGYH